MSIRLLFVLGFVCASSHAADFYIDPVNGSNAGDGSAAMPWRILQNVVDSHLIQRHNWSGSTAIDAGSALLAPSTDIALTPRSKGAMVDLGAYEFREICQDGFGTP